LKSLPEILKDWRSTQSPLVQYKNKIFYVRKAAFEEGGFIAYDGKGMLLYIDAHLANDKVWALASDSQKKK
jgi:hypothetical protein